MRLPLACALLATVACAHLRGGSRDDLDAQIAAYCKALHWKDFDAAGALVVPEHRTRWRQRRDAARDEQDLSIDECEERQARLSPAGDSAVALVRLRWTRLPDPVEKGGVVEQHWRYRNGVWLLLDDAGAPLAPPRPAGR